MLMDGNFLTTLLNLQFRTHNKTYDPVGHIVYKDKVRSNTKISTPPPALQALLKGFPLTVNIQNKLFKIPSFLNFLNIDRESVSSINRSSSNTTEVIAVEELVKSLMQMGKMVSEICVLTGYIQQKNELRARAFLKNWSHVTISTISIAQGREWDVVILSFVKISGDPGFIEMLEQANMACSRHRSTLYLIGKWEFWGATYKIGNKYISRLIQ